MVKNNQKILFISLNQEKNPIPVFPLGIGFLLPALNKQKTDYRLLDLCFKVNPGEELARVIKEYDPSVICIGIRNLDNESMLTHITYVPYIKEMITVCRCNSGSKIVAGGPGFSIMFKEFFRELNPDIGVIGEGEEILCSVLANIDNDSYLKSREYLITPGDSAVKRYAPYLAKESLTCVMPDRLQFDPGYYTWKSFGILNIVPVQTRRGCCFSCNYCGIPGFEGNTIRLRDIKLVIEELKSLVACGIHDIFFVDNVFNYPPEYSEELCRKIIEEKIQCNWMCYLSAKKLSPALAELMQAAGCTIVYFGADHFTDKILDGFEKGYTFRELEKTNQTCLAAGLRTVHYLLLGGPGENALSLESCLERIRTISCFAVFISVGIRVYPGTALYARAKTEGSIAPGNNPLYPVFYFAPGLELNSLLVKLKNFTGLKWENKIVKCTFPIEKFIKEEATLR